MWILVSVWLVLYIKEKTYLQNNIILLELSKTNIKILSVCSLIHHLSVWWYGSHTVVVFVTVHLSSPSSTHNKHSQSSNSADLEVQHSLVRTEWGGLCIEQFNFFSAWFLIHTAQKLLYILYIYSCIYCVYFILNLKTFQQMFSFRFRNNESFIYNLKVHFS